MSSQKVKVRNSFFLLYSDCIPVKGWSKSSIYDLQMGKEYSLQLALHGLIKQAKENTIDNLLKLHNKKYRKPILKHFDTLVKEELGFYTDDPSQFPDLPLDWDHPGTITNAILDFTGNYELNKIVKLIEKLQCEAVQLIVPDSLKKTESILKELSDETWLKSIEVLADYTNAPQNKKLTSLCEKYGRVNLICFYNSPKYKEVDGKRNMRFIYNDTKVKACNYYTVKPEQWIFVINIPFFTESQKHHTYFNRKLYIGPTGDIKNAPECEDVIGNVNKQSTEEVIAAIKNPANQKYWYVHKELCDVCKHCEFRHMCFENRIPYQRKDGTWYHKEECNYNPYIGKWKGEEGYKTLEQSGVISNQYAFIIDHNKVEKTNKEIWGYK